MDDFKEWNCNFGSEHARDLFLLSNGIDNKNKSPACSELKLQFHSLKSSLASYNPSTLFLTLNLILGSWKWSQMIPHTQKHTDRHQKQVSSMFRTQVLGLLQPLHPVLVLQGSLKWSQMIPHGQKHGVWHQNKPLEGSEEFLNFRPCFCRLRILKRPKIGEKTWKWTKRGHI